jgi:hypothetical protein
MIVEVIILNLIKDFCANQHIAIFTKLKSVGLKHEYLLEWIHLSCFLFPTVVLGMEPRGLGPAGKCFTTKQHPSLLPILFMDIPKKDISQ